MRDRGLKQAKAVNPALLSQELVCSGEAGTRGGGP